MMAIKNPSKVPRPIFEDSNIFLPPINSPVIVPTNGMIIMLINPNGLNINPMINPINPPQIPYFVAPSFLVVKTPERLSTITDKIIKIKKKIVVETVIFENPVMKA